MASRVDNARLRGCPSGITTAGSLTSRQLIRLVRAAVFVACLISLIWLVGCEKPLTYSFIEANGEVLEVFCQGRLVCRTGQVVTIERFSPEADFLAIQENEDGTAEVHVFFKDGSDTELVFKRDAAEVTIAVDDSAGDSATNHIALTIRVVDEPAAN